MANNVKRIHRGKDLALLLLRMTTPPLLLPFLHVCECNLYCCGVLRPSVRPTDSMLYAHITHMLLGYYKFAKVPDYTHYYGVVWKVKQAVKVDLHLVTHPSDDQ